MRNTINGMNVVNGDRVMEIGIIKSESQYRDYLKMADGLILVDPSIDSPEGRRLELLAKLIEDYEKEHFPIALPDPIEAILFRMEQDGLRQKDIAPYLGGKNRASEVLGRKRPLTLPMIRSLHENLGIPSELLIRETTPDYDTPEEIDESKVPIDLLIKRGWLDAKLTVSDLLLRLQAPVGSPVRLRNTMTYGAGLRTNQTNVWLWLARVRELGDSQADVHARFKREELTEDLIRYVVRLSKMEKGPRLAKEFLEESGISLIIEPHLPKTHLDGAAMLGRNGTPIIGLSLRHDRVDNFWFTLAHELVHAWKHLDRESRQTIVDENIDKQVNEDDVEREANALAGEILIPTHVWRRSDVYFDPNASTIRTLARELDISPAIVAGRVRYEQKNYARFSKLVGSRQVRKLFPEIVWNG